MTKVPMARAEQALQRAALMTRSHKNNEDTQLDWIAFGALFMLACDCASQDGNLPELLREVERLRSMFPGPPTGGGLAIVKELPRAVSAGDAPDAKEGALAAAKAAARPPSGSPPPSDQ